MPLIDLHTHSTASDGMTRPTDLIDLAARARLVAVALTDHDTTDGLAEAADRATRYPELRFVPGIEISAAWAGDSMHLLGLQIDPAAASIADLCGQLRQAREERNPKMVAKLRALGVPITMDDVLACCPGGQDPDRRVVSRMHIARALQKLGAVKDVTDAMAKYIGPGAPAFVDKERLTPAEAIAAVHAGGGLAVLAHPVLLGLPNRLALERVIVELQSAGLDGLECYHSAHSPEQTRLYLDLARRRGLRVSGGSDFHGSNKPDVRLGRPRVPASAWFGGA